MIGDGWLCTNWLQIVTEVIKCLVRQYPLYDNALAMSTNCDSYEHENHFDAD